jgi:hypothetical protein
MKKMQETRQKAKEKRARLIQSAALAHGSTE